MSIIDSVFQPVLGKMCWNVKHNFGSMLTFEFGEPHFEVIREPRVIKSKKRWLIRSFARRIVNIRGDWHLWIYLCDWRFYRNNVLVGDSEAKKREMRQITYDLDGQAIISVSVKANGAGISVFEFDLGGRLETQPYPQESEASEVEDQWMFYQPSGMVFTLGSNGKYRNYMGNQPTPDEWISIDNNPERGERPE